MLIYGLKPRGYACVFKFMWQKKAAPCYGMSRGSLYAGVICYFFVK